MSAMLFPTSDRGLCTPSTASVGNFDLYLSDLNQYEEIRKEYDSLFSTRKSVLRVVYIMQSHSGLNAEEERSFIDCIRVQNHCARYRLLHCWV